MAACARDAAGVGRPSWRPTQSVHGGSDGRVGVGEAGLTYGLQAVGVPSAIALSTATGFRLVTFCLPPLWGSLAMRWLRKRAYG